MQHEEIKQLAEAYGFLEIESKNPHMYSFQKEENNDARINVYFTTGTVTVQYKSAKPMKSHKQVELEEFEDILMNI